MKKDDKKIIKELIREELHKCLNNISANFDINVKKYAIPGEALDQSFRRAIAKSFSEEGNRMMEK